MKKQMKCSKIRIIWDLLWAKRYIVVTPLPGNKIKYSNKSLRVEEMMTLAVQVGGTLQSVIDQEQALDEAKNILNGL